MKKDNNKRYKKEKRKTPEVFLSTALYDIA